MRPTLAALALLAPLLAVAAPPASADFDTTCAAGATNVYRWTGGDASPLWNKAANWAKPTAGTWPAVPNDDRDNDGEAEFNQTIVCIEASDTVTLDGNQVLASFVFLRELHVRGEFTIDIGVPVTDSINAGLILHGPEESSFGFDTTVNVKASTLGGSGTVRNYGVVDVQSVTIGPSTFASTLTSRRIGETHAYTPGTLAVDEGGRLLLSSGANLKAQYQVEVRGQATFTGAAFLAADSGTSFSLLPNTGPGGRLTLAGDGGYYQGVVSGTPSAFVNEGRLHKTMGTGTSVIDAAYSGSGEVIVDTGQLSLPDQTSSAITATVASGGNTFSTGRCGPGQSATGGTCAPLTTTADPRSVSFETPDLGPDPDVTLQELATTGASLYPYHGVSRVTYAHADGMTASTTDPARIVLRYSTGTGPEGTQGLTDDQLLVSRIPDGGSAQTLVDCGSTTTIPAGQAACVDRATSQTTGGNVYLVVLTQQTSRWVVRGREQVRAFAPGAPRIAGLIVKRRGYVDAVLGWRAGASNGAAITGYRVIAHRSNGTRRYATGWVRGPRASVRLPRGRWRLAVIARNSAGVSKSSSRSRTFTAR